MSAPATTEADVLSAFFTNVMQFAAEAQRSLTGSRMVRGGSRCLAMAVEAGLPPQMAYTVSQTERYTGLTRSTLYDEMDSGRLAYVLPRGKDKGRVIQVEEMDRWMEENTVS